MARTVISIEGKRLPPPPRKVVIERLPIVPAKPQSVLVERWLPYPPAKRRVIYQPNTQKDPQILKPRNVIVQWESPQVNVKKDIKFLGVVKANPQDYVQKYGSQLRSARDLPPVVNEIRTPEGLVLAADSSSNQVQHELEGDLQALRLVDLDKEGLGAYKEFLQRIGGPSGASGSVSAAVVATSAVSPTTTLLSRSSSQNALQRSASSSKSNSNSDLAANIEQIFNALTRNNENRISREDAERALLVLNSRLGRSYGEDDVLDFFEQLDINRDGFIDFEEFKTLALL